MAAWRHQDNRYARLWFIVEELLSLMPIAVVDSASGVSCYVGFTLLLRSGARKKVVLSLSLSLLGASSTWGS
jgi:hypothetical protein